MEAQVTCRVCKLPITQKNDAVFLTSTNKVTKNPAHRECYEREVRSMVKDPEFKIHYRMTQVSPLLHDLRYHGKNYSG